MKNGSNDMWPADTDGMLKANHITPQDCFRLDNNITPYASFPDIMQQDTKQHCLDILESLWPIMKNYPIPTLLPTTSQDNLYLDYKFSPFSASHYQMFCPLNKRFTEDTIQLSIGSRNSLADTAAAFYDTGIYSFCMSDSIRQFAERVTGYSLKTHNRSGILIVCYNHGDYIGAHTDVTWPYTAGWTKEKKAISYVDVYFSFVNDAVDEQWIIIQNGCHLNKVYGGRPPINGTISVDRLPFWHYVTPLRGKPGQESRARRWLVMINFEIADGNNAPKILA